VVPRHRRWRLIGQISNGVAAACVAAAVLVLCAAGIHGSPAIGRALDPGHGAWAPAADAQLPKPEVLRAAGLTSPALVSFDPHGVATVQAGRLTDATVALGYLHARFRLTQMDLQRRMAEGRLSQLVGASGLASDEFELRLGLLRTARQEWAAMPKDSLGARLLIGGAEGRIGAPRLEPSDGGGVVRRGNLVGVLAGLPVRDIRAMVAGWRSSRCRRSGGAVCLSGTGWVGARP
jgi:hypothetical protein